MSKNNIKLLTDKELQMINARYVFLLENDKVIVTFPFYSRKTVHSINDSFSVNIKSIRRITFTAEAMKIWKEILEKRKTSSSKPTLVDIQNAVNKLYILYQRPTTSNVEKILDKESLKIKHV